jgi:two-component system cell cycle sensor histidine kinase PleC
MTRRHEGTGLGLPLVKNLVELHHGIFKIESAIGKGTKAYVRFPVNRSVPKTQPLPADVIPISDKIKRS